ncbi:dipeptidase [Paracoccus alkanivorans]|uniref:Membrane dipeptidase n=1 Tax=Paracoccus alkanivorans TaxID=2116655 RepID=A0A3M0LWT7_9RHOB|nr:dipeptidase [Paracoccus alkanivorans]RMC29816.1 membrane dipeptidase [Paracoccus alkanivorans]
MSSEIQKLHDSAILIDAVCPLLQNMSNVDDYRKGGFTAVAPTVGAWNGCGDAVRNIGQWYKLIRERDDLMLIKTAADIRTAKVSGKTGIILHFQGTGPIEDSLDLIDAFRGMGVGVMQLAYNIKNRVGDGCEERTDSGLSRFGLQVIERMNKAKMIIDCSHTGQQTTYDAIEHSSAPVIISHANARAVHDSPRNLPDELIKAIGANGGTIGIVGFPGFVSGDKRPTIDQFIDHMAYMADMIGIDRVTLGIDYYTGQDPYIDVEAAKAAYNARIADNTWSPKAYPPPPHHYPAGIETPATMPALTEALLRRGFTEEDIRKVYGENLIRMYETVWGE